MAVEPKAAVTAEPVTKPKTSLEVGVESDIITSSEGGKAKTLNQDASSVEFGADGKPLAKEPTEAAAAEGEDGKEAPADAPLNELGEWKKDDPEVQSKFDAVYFKDGLLNMDALSAEFWKGHAADPKDGGLTEATYGYLQDTLGIGKDMAKDIEKSLLHARQSEAAEVDAKVFQLAGGRDALNAALKWGREGGYTEEQRARFNTLRQKGGEDYEDAVVALMARFEKANPGAGRRGPPNAQRRSSPERTVGGGSAVAAPGGDDAPAVPAFKNYEEYSVAYGKAIVANQKAKTPAEKRSTREAIDKLRAAARKARLA